MVLTVYTNSTSLRTNLIKNNKKILEIDFERIGLEGSFYTIDTDEFKRRRYQHT